MPKKRKTYPRWVLWLLIAVILIGIPSLYAYMDSRYREQERWLQQLEVNMREAMSPPTSSNQQVDEQDPLNELLPPGLLQLEQADEVPSDPDQALRQRVLTVGRTYRKYSRVDEQKKWERKSSQQFGGIVSHASWTRSEDESTHGGQKLNYAFARVVDAYSLAGVNDDDVPERLRAVTQSQNGQAIVLSSWIAREVTEAPQGSNPEIGNHMFGQYFQEETADTYPIASDGDKFYYAAEKVGLFMMLRADENNAHEMEHAMNGWIFATTTPDGDEIIGLGKIESCVQCHQDAPHRGGLFVLQQNSHKD
mgnify:FL=1